jgi:hypothetical protein
MRPRTSERHRLGPKIPYNTCIAKTSRPSRIHVPRTRKGKKLCRCPSRIPKDFLQLLDGPTGSLLSTSGILVVEQLTLYQYMLCVKHLLVFALMTLAIVLLHKAVIKTDSLTLGHSMGRRRSRSLPDISSDIPPHKRRRLEEVASSNSYISDIDPSA